MAGSSPDVAASNESKKPKDSPFNQQQLPAWQPILTAGTVLPTFFVIGIAFVAIGSGLLYFSNRVLEYHVDYTDCKNNVGDHCWNVTLHQNFTEECKCEVKIEVTEDMEKPVFMYYGLTNFYQNHRRYVKSRDEKQLLGNIEAEPTDDCDPYKQDKETGKFIVPCGAIANSLFNDEIVLKKDGKAVTLLNTGIAWESDKKYKFKNPELPEGVTLEAYLKNNTAKPRDWKKNLWELDPDNPQNNGLQNEDLIVWMRTAAFPNFRKLYRKIDHDNQPEYKDSLPAGNYTLDIVYNYRVRQFSGTKSIYLSQTSILGGKNPFLGIAYIVVGSICFIIGIAFLVIHIKYGKLTNEMMEVGGGSGGR